mmetsp:Transcript_1776/g.2203  ORF Transcript_1776/g.2203 Transcript_1776/m.2203 type:complete len:81 (-) Transcript_1776:408-650(-)
MESFMERACQETPMAQRTQASLKMAGHMEKADANGIVDGCIKANGSSINEMDSGKVGKQRKEEKYTTESGKTIDGMARAP